MLAESVLEAVVEREPRRGRLRDHRSNLTLFHRLADACLIVASLAVAVAATDARWSPSMTATAALGMVVFYFVAEAKKLYRSWRTEPILRETASTIEIWLIVAGISVLAVYFQQDPQRYPPSAMAIWMVLTPVLLSAWRIGFRHTLRTVRAHGLNSRRLAIAGSGELARHVGRTVAENAWMGFRIVGLYDDTDGGRATPGRARVKGSLDDLVEIARGGELDVIYVALPPGNSERQANALIRRLSDSTASVYLVQDRRSRDPETERSSRQVVPDLERVDVLQRTSVNLGGIRAVSVYESPFLGPDQWLKRIEDIVISSIALMLLAVPMTVIALGVKMSSPGPVFFKQRRYGLDGREILVWKFRSMTVCEDSTNVKQAQKNDSRITPFGGFLRRTSLDELPQFINVFLGSMSIVGPRPHAVAHNEQYRAIIGGYMLRHKVKPGITGWAQVNGWRGETESVDKMGRRVDFDLDYIRNWSLWMDIRIVLMTFIRGFVHKNAY